MSCFLAFFLAVPTIWFTNNIELNQVHPPPRNLTLTYSILRQKQRRKSRQANKHTAHEVEPGSKPPGSCHEQEPGSRVVILIHIIQMSKATFCQVSSNGDETLETGRQVRIQRTAV